ncbi:apolipoprotein B receptor isoform X2 [Sarcophilus harrisii]|uniref:apolipoprotein B receptor isoform X2 n=1 Tax=Sarcophilus harrisii TaxID=9305 RepID=UPI001301F122|nr:apolipoprotein B receptor isoform X2 [Sarcophilus harrisii]
MELLRLHFPGVHRALREALDSLSTFASYLLGDTVPSAEGRGGNLSTRDGDKGKEPGEMTPGGSQQNEVLKETLEKREVIRDLEDSFFSRGSETREAWDKGEEKKARRIQESEAEEIWEIGKKVGVDLDEEMTRVCTTWDSSNKNSKEAKGEIRGYHKIEVREAWCMMGTEPKQGQKTDAVEARECKKEGILAEEYLETKGFVSEEKDSREPKAQGRKNQNSSKKEVNVGKAENYWKEEETEPVGEQKEDMEEIKPGDLEGRALIAFRVESENPIIWEKEKEDRRAQELEGNVRDWQEAKEGEKAQRMKKGHGQKIGMETRKSHEIKEAPNEAVQGEFGKDMIIEKQEVEKHEIREAQETQRIGIRCEKKEMDKEVALEVQGLNPIERDLEKLQGIQEPGEEAERGDNVMSEIWITSVMEKAESREVVRLRAAETSPKKEDEEAWKVDKESGTKWNVEVIQRGWDTEETSGEDLESRKEERETEESPFPKQVQIQRTEREEEVADFWVLGKKEIVKVLESEVEVEGSSGLEGEAGEHCENQSGQTTDQDSKETKIWEGTLNNVSRSKEIESVEAEEVMGGCKLEPGSSQEVEQTERIADSDETSVTRPEKEVGGSKLTREEEVGKRQELEAKDEESHETERVREDQDSDEIGANWNMEAETGRAQETEKEPSKVQDLMEEELKGKEEEEPFRISEEKILESCEIGTYSAQNIKNTEIGNVQEVKKHDSMAVEGWKTMEREFESCQVMEIKAKGGSEDEEEVFTPQIREDRGNQEAKESQEFKKQEVPTAEVNTSWGTRKAGTTEPEMEEKELEGGQEAQGGRGHKVGESEVSKLQEREATKAKESWEVEEEVIGNQQMKEIEGSQERQGESSNTLEREAEVWQGNARSLRDTERENEGAGLNLKEADDRRSQETEQKVKRDQKEIKRDWDSEEAISHEIMEVREIPGSNLLEVGGREALEEEDKDFQEVEGTEECHTAGRMTDRDQVVEESEIGRTWEREEEESEGEQETGSAEAKESWVAEKEEAGSKCEKESFASYQGAEIQMAMTKTEVKLGRGEELEGQLKSEEKPEEGQGNRETKPGLDGDQRVSTWALEEETQCEGDTQTEAKAWGSHAIEGEASMDNQFMEEVEANGGRRLEAVMTMASRQGDENKEELEPAKCCDTERCRGGDEDSEAPGAWESSEKPGSGWDLQKAEPGQVRGTKEVAATDSGALEASENGGSEATAPINTITIRLSPEPNPAEAHSSWNEAPIPGPCLDLSIPRSRVLLSRNASQRRSRPSFRRAPAPKQDDSNDGDESLGFLPNEGSPASKLRLLQSEETAVPSPPKAEGTPVTARKRPLGHGFGLAHPNMMQELQARLGRPKPQ